jgi:hypothetical protein
VRKNLKIARIYLRVSTVEQDLTRQADIEQSTRTAGYYVAGVYREKASGARADRPELLRMIADLQPVEVVIAEKIDRISRLPLAEAEQLVSRIRGTGAKLAVPGLVDLSDIAVDADGVAKIVLESVQELLLKLALQMARDDYENWGQGLLGNELFARSIVILDLGVSPRFGIIESDISSK